MSNKLSPSENCIVCLPKLQILKLAVERLAEELKDAHANALSARSEAATACAGTVAARAEAAAALAEAERAEQQLVDMERKHQEEFSVPAVRDKYIAARQENEKLKEEIEKLSYQVEKLQEDNRGFKNHIEAISAPEALPVTFDGLWIAIEEEQSKREVSFGSRISLRTINSKYVSNSYFSFMADRPEANKWEKFTTEKRGFNRFALITFGKYVAIKDIDKISAEREVNSVQDRKDGDFLGEEFEVNYVYKTGEWTSWKSVLTGKYLGTDSKGGLLCNAEAVGLWEWFHVDRI